MKKEKYTPFQIVLRGKKLFMTYYQFQCPEMSIEVTPIYHFVRDVILNTWTVEDFKKAQKTRLTIK